jgi:hypothetical protein
MGSLIRAAVVLFCVAMAMQGIGCTRSGEPSLSEKETDPLRGDSVGYYEVPHEGIIYVVGSIQSRDKVRSEQLPPTTSGGFSSQGQPVLFETGSAGLTERLKAEYRRRHGLSSP